MRVWFGGPRLFGLRTGFIFGPEDFRAFGRSAAAVPSAVSFVYVIRDGLGRHKVGSSVDPNARIRTLQTGSADRLAFAYVAVADAPMAERIERRAHDILARSNVNLEWFACPPEAAVAALHAAAHSFGVGLVPVSADRIDEVRRLAAPGRRGWAFDNYAMFATFLFCGGGLACWVLAMLAPGSWPLWLAPTIIGAAWLGRGISRPT